MIAHLKMLLCTFLIFSCYACDKEVTPQDLQVHFEGSVPLKDLIFEGEDWIAVGGETFQSGIIAKGNLTTTESSIEQISERCINSILQHDSSTTSSVYFTTGVYSFGALRNGLWNISTNANPFILREITESNGYLYAAGGAGLSSGIIYTLTPDLDLVHTEDFTNDLYFVRKIGDKIFVGGFGALIYADNDTGPSKSWNIIDTYEDHWLDIEYVEDFGIVVLGASGRIIKSNNEGNTWEEIMTPTVAGVTDFKDLLIYSGKIYLACGENICASDVNNIDFQTINLAGLGEINRLAGNNGRIYFVTDSGQMLSIVH